MKLCLYIYKCFSLICIYFRSFVHLLHRSFVSFSPLYLKFCSDTMFHVDFFLKNRATKKHDEQ